MYLSYNVRFLSLLTIKQVGNLANDGIKLASLKAGNCSAEPDDGLEHEANGGTLRYV